MAMPKTTVNKNHCAVFRQHQIRLPWQIAAMKSEAKSCTVKQGPNLKFW